MKGILEIGPKAPNWEYITKRCKMLKGKTPTHAITLKYHDGEGVVRNYNPGDLSYDLKKKYKNGSEVDPTHYRSMVHIEWRSY